MTAESDQLFLLRGGQTAVTFASMNLYIGIWPVYFIYLFFFYFLTLSTGTSQFESVEIFKNSNLWSLNMPFLFNFQWYYDDHL